MNIYEFRFGGERDWICAHTLIEALQFYHSLNDMNIDDFSAGDDIVLIPKEEWPQHSIVDMDSYSEDAKKYETVCTFAEYMETAVKPDIIATTVF